MIAEAQAGAGVPQVPAEGPLAEQPTAMPVLYAALFAVAPDEQGNGGVELVAPGYTRAMVFFEGGIGGTIQNREIIWPEAAAENWPAAVAMGFMDGPTGDEFAIVPPMIFSKPMQIQQGYTAQLSSGLLKTKL